MDDHNRFRNRSIKDSMLSSRKMQRVIAVAIYLRAYRDGLTDTVILITRNVHPGKHSMYTDYRYAYISARVYA